MGTRRGLVAIRGDTESILGNEGVTGIGGEGCHAPTFEERTGRDHEV